MEEQVITNRHTYGMWFMSNSLTADYGTFECGQCGRTFYHSPSEIYKDGKTVYECCCGYCTNNIIFTDWHSKPYL